MIYHQFVQFEHFENKVCYGFQHILATWCIHWSYPFKQMCDPNGSPFHLPYLGYNMTYEPTIHIRDL